MGEAATILLVDDHERNLDALEAILEPTGYELVRARSAEEALLALLNQDFAAIVCDIRMPGTGGIELARMIKERKRTRHIPILFLTAHLIEEDDVLRGYGVGAVDYLSKPLNPDILRSKLGVFVELFTKSRALSEANQALIDEVAERERAQEELRQAKEQLEQRVEERTAELMAANRAKDHFLAVLSHELRTPLTPVLASVQELLRSNESAPETRESLELIQRNVELEARLIDDLLDITRISRGKLELHCTVVDVHQILEHALRTCDADFRGKGITVRRALDAKSATVWGDRARLLQTFWNLLKNAAKFTPEGGSVNVSTHDRPDGHLRVEIHDSGIGMERPMLDSIFKPFEQGNVDVTRRFGGLGLGLSICKALTEMHGGTVIATSAGAGQGSTFILDLPLTRAGVSTPRPLSRRPDDNGTPAADSPHRGLRLLLVEDHVDTARVMERLLKRSGYEVVTADGVTSALMSCAAAPRPFDLVVSDIGLPDGSGLDLMRQLRARFPGTPGVALSGFGMEDDRQKSRDAGFSAHLTKPVDLDTLHATIEQMRAHPATDTPSTGE